MATPFHCMPAASVKPFFELSSDSNMISTTHCAVFNPERKSNKEENKKDIVRKRDFWKKGREMRKSDSIRTGIRME